MTGPAVAARALVIAAVAGVAAGCGGSRHAAPQTTSSKPQACPLSAAQRRDVVKAKREIALMYRLEQPLRTVHATGPMKLELAVNRFLLDVGPLPAKLKGDLMAKAKSSVGLCQDCFNAIEAMEPVVQTRLGRSPCSGR